jgi:phytoene synthase
MKTEFYIKHHGKSFYWAGKFLEKEIFDDCSILYAFCRVVDNLVDEKSNSKNNIKKFIKDYQNKSSKNLVINKFKKIEAKYKIPKKYIQDLFYGVNLDTKPVKIKTTKELLKYSYYVAGTVGAMMAYIFNTTNSKAIKCAINLGIAMQLTNISRDVLKDACLQRIYIPKNFIKENIVAKDIVNNNFNKKNLFFSIKKLILLADKYYNSGNNGIKFLPKKIRFPIFLASSIYQNIGKKILNNNENDYFLKRTYLNFLEKIIMTIKSFYIFVIIKESYKNN